MKKPRPTRSRPGFTLMETVIAIGVLAVLLSTFLAVFAPAAQGIRKAISVQEADRLAHALQQELVTLHKGDSAATGFEKGFQTIIDSADPDKLLLVYLYRGDPDSVRSDGSLAPFEGQGVAGTDFVVRPVVRMKNDPEFEKELEALEGRIYVVKMTQLVYDGDGALIRGTPGEITDPRGEESGGDAESYPDAVVAVEAEFFRVPNSSFQYIAQRLNSEELDDPMFSRNLAIRR